MILFCHFPMVHMVEYIKFEGICINKMCSLEVAQTTRIIFPIVDSGVALVSL